MPSSTSSHATRQKLLDQGIEAFIQRGYHGVGIKEILDAVGVPKGSFYNYFKSKEDYAAQVIRHFSGRFLERLRTSLDASGEGSGSGDAEADDPMGALRRFFEGEIRCCERDDCRKGCLIGTLGAELGGSSEACREVMAETLAEGQDLIERVLVKGQQTGVVRADVPAGDLAASVLNGWEGSLIRMKVDGCTDPLRQFCNIFLNNLLSP